MTKAEGKALKENLIFFFFIKLGEKKKCFLPRLKLGYENCTMEFHINVWKKKWANF